MRLLVSVFAVLVVFVSLSFSQVDDEYRENLKMDFRQVNVVAYIEIEKVEIEFEWGKPNSGGGYTMYRLTGKIIESFKGKTKRDKPIVFYSFREGQPPTEDLKRNYIRFLKNSKNDKGQKVLLELENSGALVNETNLSTLRKLR